MNKQRRTKIRKISVEIYKCYEVLSAIKDALEDIQYDEQEALDNMPESLQGTDRYEAMAEANGALEEQVNELDSIITNLEQIQENLDEI